MLASSLLIVEWLLEFVMRDNRLSVYLNTHLISRIAMEFVIIVDELNIWLGIKVFDVIS